MINRGDYHFGVVDGGMGLLTGLNPLPVKISAREIAPIIANNNPINIKHGHNLKHKIIPQHPGRTTIAQQIINNILNDETGHRLARMDTCRQDYGLLLFVWTIADYQIVTTKIMSGCTCCLIRSGTGIYVGNGFYCEGRFRLS